MSIMKEKTMPRPAETIDPFAPPNWRWLAAENIAQGTKLIDSYRGDRHVLAAVDHLRSCNPHPSKGFNPAINEALGVFSDHASLVKAELEARLVSGQALRDIARACQMPDAVVDMYHGIFFDAPPAATDYVRVHVIGHGPSRGFRNDEVRQFWAWAAMGGGPIILQVLLDSFRRAHRTGRVPTLDTYLRRNANVLIDVKAFVALNVIPWSAAWDLLFLNLKSQLDEASTVSDPKSRALKLASQQLRVINAGRAALKGAIVPPAELFLQGRTRQVKSQEKVCTKQVQATDVSSALFDHLFELLRSR
jgi:hypothetical protein